MAAARVASTRIIASALRSFASFAASSAARASLSAWAWAEVASTRRAAASFASFRSSVARCTASAANWRAAPEMWIFCGFSQPGTDAGRIFQAFVPCMIRNLLAIEFLHASLFETVCSIGRASTVNTVCLLCATVTISTTARPVSLSQ